jgi:hypothetical protein
MVEAVQVVLLHQLDELRAVPGIGGVDAGQCRGERIRILALCHGTRVVAAAGQEPTVGVDALRDALIDLEGRGEVHELAVDHLLRRLHVTPHRAGSLDPEQVVVVGCQDALAPAGLVDGLGDGDGGWHAVLALSGHGAARDLADEGLLGCRAGQRRTIRRHVVPVVRGERARVARMVVCLLEQSRDGCLAMPGPVRPGWPEARCRDACDRGLAAGGALRVLAFLSR